MRATAPRAVIRRLAIPSILVVVVVVVVWLWFSPGIKTFPLDDAYIHLAYARNLAAHGELAFNPGEPSIGTSSLSWTALLAITRPLGDYWPALILSLAFLAAAGALAGAIVEDAVARFVRFPARALGGVAAALVVLDGHLLWMAGSGMETTFAVMLGLLAVHLHAKRGLDAWTGVVLGLAVLARPTSIVLAFVIALVTWIKRMPSVRGLVAGALVASPGIFLTWRIGGSAIPTSARGKVLTYVGSGLDLHGMLHFAERSIAFQKFVPHNFVLVFAAALAAWIVFTDSGSLREKVRRALDHTSLLVCVAWGVLHFAAYAIGFRTLGQQGRYLAEESAIVVVLGVSSFGILFREAWARRGIPLVASVCVAASVLGLPYWKRVYRDNVRHVDEAYVRMAEHIARKTPTDARIAAFDIGIVRYVGDRYTIDLGGLIDPNAHPCLRARECGDYARRMGATHFLYSREPEADNITGIHRAETHGPTFLREVPIATYSFADYSAPTLTHSLRMDLERVDGWFDVASMDVARAFAPGEELSPLAATHGDLQLLGGALDTRHVYAMRGYPYFFSITLLVRSSAPIVRVPWLHVGMFDGERLDTAYHEPMLHGLVSPERWPIATPLRDRHVFYVPYAESTVRWRVRVAISDGADLDVTKVLWTDVSDLESERSALDPLAPL